MAIYPAAGLHSLTASVVERGQSKHLGPELAQKRQLIRVCCTSLVRCQELGLHSIPWWKPYSIYLSSKSLEFWR